MIGQPNKWYFHPSVFVSLADEFGVNNLVGKTNLSFALEYVASADYVIGFDGIFVFFSSLFKIPTMNFSILNPNPRLDETNDTCGCWKDHCLLIKGIPGGVPIVFSIEQFKIWFGQLNDKKAM